MFLFCSWLWHAECHFLFFQFLLLLLFFKIFFNSALSRYQFLMYSCSFTYLPISEISKTKENKNCIFTKQTAKKKLNSYRLFPFLWNMFSPLWQDINFFILFHTTEYRLFSCFDRHIGISQREHFVSSCLSLKIVWITCLELLNAKVTAENGVELVSFEVLYLYMVSFCYSSNIFLFLSRIFNSEKDVSVLLFL